MAAGLDIVFLGPGQMGEPMVERMLDAGHAVRTWSSRADARERLAARGAVVATSPAAAARGLRRCVACVLTEGQLREVLFDGGVLDALAPGALIVSHVTGSGRGIRGLSDELAARGFVFVDAPVSGTPVDIRAGRLAVLLGGADAAVHETRELVSAYSDWTAVTGGVGTATELKLVNNALFAIHAQAAALAVRVAEAVGCDPEAALAVWQRCSGNSAALAHLARYGGADIARVVGHLAKDVASLRADAREAGIPLDGLEAMLAAGPLPIVAQEAAA